MWLQILIVYLVLGLVFGVSFLVECFIGDILNYIRGCQHDHKFGPAWKSGMTYFMAGTMICPIVNLFWVFLYVGCFVGAIRQKRDSK